MPFIVPKVLKFKPPDAALPNNNDVVGYRVRIALDTGAGSASKYNLAFTQVPKGTPDAQGFISVDLAALPGSDQLDGSYDVSVTAVDEVGNESAFLSVENSAFDFVAPGAPTLGSIV